MRSVVIILLIFFWSAQADNAWLANSTSALLACCQHRGTGDINATFYEPDCSGHYKAMWVRDFTYMVLYASDFLDPASIRSAIDTIRISQDNVTGFIPDNVATSGQVSWGPWPWQSTHCIDNSIFYPLLVAAFVNWTGDCDSFASLLPSVDRALRAVPLDQGLTWNDPGLPTVTYGFVDSVIPTGHLLFTSLLLYQAATQLLPLTQKCDVAANSSFYTELAVGVKTNLNRLLLDNETGLLFHASNNNRRRCVWGSLLAVELDLVPAGQQQQIVSFIESQLPNVVFAGQFRHLVAPEGWFPNFAGFDLGTYQNGAYWATPNAWALPAIAKFNVPLANKLLQDCVNSFKSYGIMECLNEQGYHGAVDYVASVTNVYYASKRLAQASPAAA
eukprot:TRINITY_DN4280_c0_g1_i2.p1 TRINITY_DN4280_c0_g1~~TRINITY_DN4280_c0_g1_i2.p1  ORF type:complete len:388 (-),score=64.13 TRINITY_DN4280_c0_g1_i2:1199-2362(-)